MDDDRIELILRQADEATGGPPPGPTDLPDRVRRLARRRRMVRIAGGTTALLAAAVGAVLFLAARSSPPTPAVPSALVEQTPSPDEVARLRAEVDRLRAEADATGRLVRELLARQEKQASMAAYRRVMAGPDPIEQIDRQIDRAAVAILYEADRMNQELGLREPALESYRELIRWLPDSRWADTARRRIADLDDSKGERS